MAMPYEEAIERHPVHVLAVMLEIIEQQYVQPIRMLFDMKDRLRSLQIPSYKLAFSEEFQLGVDEPLQGRMEEILAEFDRLKQEIGPLASREAMSDEE